MLDVKDASIILSSPNTRAITLEFDPRNMTANVAGAATSVPPEAHVMVANLELGTFVLVKAGQDGTFQAEIDGHPGTHILIKQDTTGQIFNVEDPEATHGPNTLRTIFPPGVLLRIPVRDSETGISFSSAGRLPSDSDAPWTIQAEIASVQLTPGQKVPISGQIAILTGQSTPPPSTGQLRFETHFLMNADGRQVGGARIFTTTLFTPTNLPIESKNLLEGSHSVGQAQLEWRFEDERWISEFSTMLTIDEASSVGLYGLKAELVGVDGLPRKGTPNILHRSFLQKASMGTVTIGQPKPMALTSTLLADELSEGSRGGVVAREDEGLFDITPRAGVRHQPVISRLDSYGKSWKYRLEPYVPMLGVVDRAPPASPSIKLDFANSSLTIKVSRPDGNTDVLGPAPLTQYAVKSPRTPWHRTVSEGGGNLGEVPQLQNDGVEFQYEFPFDGDYVVKLDGQISDIFGRVYAITGTYDVTVANILDIEASLLPGTPFDVGDSLPLGLRVMPGMPAEIDYRITQVGPDGKSVITTFEGQANGDGWWDGNGAALTFKQDGEYRVDVEARYADTNSNLWVGRLSFGSAVATDNAPMILHGRRGPNRIPEISKPWGFTEDFKDTNADHIQFPYFAGDILWGKSTGSLARSVAVLTSIQIINDQHPLMARVKQQVGSVDGISAEELIKAGQIPLSTAAKPGTLSNGTQSDGVDLWSYIYASVQRPGVRVREHILADDVGGTYWRFDDAYHMQSGNGHQGDLPGDFKFMYAAAVIRDSESGEGVYATYGSGWVLAPDDDPLGARFMPPFQGAAGGPDGGPLFKVHGREIDMFFLPLGVRPGAVLDVGQTFRMAGPIMPTLPSLVEYKVKSPDGTVRAFEGRANSVGYFYRKDDDFVLDKPGLWKVDLTVTHDGMTSAGPVEYPYPTGGPLTPDKSNTFHFVVKGPETQTLKLETDLSQLAPSQWFSNVRQAQFEAELPPGFKSDKARIIVTMPGIVLVDENVPINRNKVSWSLNAQELNRLANNFDYEDGIADTIDVTFYVEGSDSVGKPIQASGTMVTHGARIAAKPVFAPRVGAKTDSVSTEGKTTSPNLSGLPQLSTILSNKTNQFLVDMEYVKGGHPFKGKYSKDPDDGAHVNFDNSDNKWPAGTAVTDYPPIYAIADGYIQTINTWNPVGGVNYGYGVTLLFAQQNGNPVRFNYAIEPSTNPGGDGSFYEPFIMVREGQSVSKGDILAYMYLEPNDEYPGPHIHFNIRPEGEDKQAPAIFTGEIVEAFHARWGIFRFDFKSSKVEGDIEMPVGMGYKLSASQNPYGTGEVDTVK